MGKLTEEQRDDILISMSESVRNIEKRVIAIEDDVADIKHELAKRPDEERVRQVVSEEVETALSGYRFVKVK